MSTGLGRMILDRSALGPYAAIVTEVDLPGQMVGVTMFPPGSQIVESGGVFRHMAVSFCGDARPRPDDWFAIWPPREGA